MPLPTESLTKDSDEDDIKRAISAAISQLVDEGREQDEAVAIAFETARKATGGRPRKPASNVRSRARG